MDIGPLILRNQMRSVGAENSPVHKVSKWNFIGGNYKKYGL